MVKNIFYFKLSNRQCNIVEKITFDSIDVPLTGWFSQVLEDIMKKGKIWQEIENEGLQEGRRDWNHPIH
jgi:hypothetical protein